MDDQPAALGGFIFVRRKLTNQVRLSRNDSVAKAVTIWKELRGNEKTSNSSGGCPMTANDGWIVDDQRFADIADS
jgi:hypothetical protein